ncbi:hypothetical protein BS78_10G076600 [Paspalum vaginatum]|nr:hypothetical protein BS78_10G076600 [Paspalum vaginatum]
MMPPPTAIPPTSPTDPAPSSSKKKGKEKKGVSSRGASFTHEEELLLCAAYLNVSRDPIVGTNQTSETYWQRITNYYNENRKHWPERSCDSLNSKFRSIASDTSFFVSCKGFVDRIQKSGQTEDDRVRNCCISHCLHTHAFRIHQVHFFSRLTQIKAACERFKDLKKGKDFQFLHCWRVLRGTRKWEDYVEKNNAKRKGNNDSPDSLAATSDTDSPQEIPRPIGRDKAKKMRSSGGTPTSESEAVSLFQRMAASSEQKQQLQIQWQQDTKSFQERQLEIQEKQQQDTKSFQERQIEIQEKQFQVQLQQWEWTRFQDENKIMLMDLNNVSDTAKEYFLNIQRDILGRQHRGGSSNNQ